MDPNHYLDLLDTLGTVSVDEGRDWLRRALVKKEVADLRGLCSAAGIPLKLHGSGAWKSSSQMVEELVHNLRTYAQADRDQKVFHNGCVLDRCRKRYSTCGSSNSLFSNSLCRPRPLPVADQQRRR